MKIRRYGVSGDTEGHEKRGSGDLFGASTKRPDDGRRVMEESFVKKWGETGLGDFVSEADWLILPEIIRGIFQEYCGLKVAFLGVGSELLRDTVDFLFVESAASEQCFGVEPIVVRVGDGVVVISAG